MIKKYEQFYKELKSEKKLNEELNPINWIKEQFLKLKAYFKKLKGKALISFISAILPEELLTFIKKEANLSKNESLLFEKMVYTTLDSLMNSITEEWKMMPGKSNSNLLDPEQVNKLPDNEYFQYLQQVSDAIYFETDPSGELVKYKDEEMDKKNKELYNFLITQGIEVNKEVVVENKPSLENINKKIEQMKIPPFVQKALKVLSIIVFFGLLTGKAIGSTAMPLDKDSGKKFMNTGGADMPKVYKGDNDKKVDDQKKDGDSPFSSSEYKSNGKFLRITAVGTSGSDYELAHKDADLQASNKLSQQKDELVKRLFVKFEKEVDNKSDYEENWNKNFPKNFKSESSSGQKEIAQKAYELDNGGYEYWTVKELDLQPLLDHIVNVIDQTEAGGKLTEKGRKTLYDLVNQLTKGEVEKLDKSNFSDSQSSSKVIKSEITN